MANIEIDELANYLQREFSEFSDQVNTIVEDECKKMAYEVKKELANDPNIPQSTNTQDHYKKSFAVKKATSKDGWHGYRVYNKKGQLTHLLEYGHDTSKGGRTRAFPHWEQANRKVQDLVIEIRKRLEANR